jgi:hypothetical protein
LAARTARASRRPRRMVLVLRLGTSLSKLYIPHATHRIAYAGSWRTVPGRLFLLGIHSSTEVCWIKIQAPLRMDILLIFGVLGCGRFFEGTAEEMHTALNKTLAAVPDDTKVYV